MEPRSTKAFKRDAGAALPLVIILTTVIATTVLTLASYSVTSLRYGRVAENRSDRLTAADAGLRYAIDQLKLRNAGCVLDTQEAVLPGVDTDFNGTSASVTCERITSGYEGIQAYAVVMTGEGLTNTQWLVETQSGNQTKLLGGPVYMARVDADAFSLAKDLEIKDGPLLYHDTSGAAPCNSLSSSEIVSRTAGKLIFTPELIFGPVCVSVGWKELFDSPTVPNLSLLPTRDGNLPLSSPGGSYTDVSGSGGCRVFEPGIYTSPPDVNNGETYFKSGEYLFDFNVPFKVKQATVTAGRINPIATPSGLNQISTSTQCEIQQAADSPADGKYGATFYFAQGANMIIESNGAVEIHARKQGTSAYVSFQMLCDPDQFPLGTPASERWCNPDGGGSFATPKFSTLTNPGSTSSNTAAMYTQSGNNKEFVAHALVYAPQSRIEFGNATNTSEQKMLGGMVAARVKLQSSASASNFEISVPTSPITAEIKLTSTAVKEGETSIQAVVQYRPYEGDIADRVRINSWRTCDLPGCAESVPAAGCGSADPVWTADFYDNPSLSGSVDHQKTPTSLSYNWGSGSPTTGLVPDNIPSNGFSARFTRTVDLPSAGTYRFTVGSDDGQRLWVNGVQVIDKWIPQTVTEHSADVVISDRCSVDLLLEYFEQIGQAQVYISWVKL